MAAALPQVVIVGAGFAGLAAAQALARAKVPVTVIDRRNHHLFVPLLYQVATAALSPADIAQPIRRILRHARSAEVILGEVTGLDTAGRRVLLADGSTVPYGRLILATGSRPSYFGHDGWAATAPGLKQVEDALGIRTRLLLAFEQAETCPDPEERQRLMTIVVVGGGPTGVELAGAVAELARYALSRDFRHIDPTTARILLVEAGPRLLTAFPEPLAAFAQRALEQLGVTVMLNTPVQDIQPGTVTLAGTPVRAGLVIWGAGVAANPAGHWLGVATDRMGRIAVAPDLSVPGHPDVFALGDIATLAGTDGQPLPALAQVAQQQGHHLGRALADQLRDGTPLPPFRFHNRGNTAVIGRHAAIFDFGRWRLKGWFAWVLWAIVHVYLLVGFEQRVLVTVQWLWRYLTYERGARLITVDAGAGGAAGAAGPAEPCSPDGLRPKLIR